MRLYLSSYRLGTGWTRLLSLVGANRLTAVVCNATDHRSADEQRDRLSWECQVLSDIGLKPRGLDLREFFGRPEALAERLAPVGLVWVRGGNTFILRRAMIRSGFDEVITTRVRDNSLAYGGFSAGAIAATPTLRGTELVDEPTRVPDGYRPEVIWGGLGFVDFSIAPHFRSSHPESAGMERVVAYFETHRMPYRALRDGEAIVIDGEAETVVGQPTAPRPSV